MIILPINNQGWVQGKLFIENAFFRQKDYLVNNKALKINVSGYINALMLYTTCDLEYRLCDGQDKLFITPYPLELNTLYYTFGTYKVFPIESLVIPLYNKWYYSEKLESPTLDLGGTSNDN